MKKRWKILLGVLTIIIVSSFGLIAWGRAPHKSYPEGRSMLPTIHPGQEITVKPFVTPGQGDIVEIRWTETGMEQTGFGAQWVVKRVTQVDEEGCWWLEGDNKDASYDSRAYGWICREDISYFGVVTSIKPL